MAQFQFSILGDNPADVSNDTLGFQTFVRPFSERLIQSVGNTPFTVGIYADWGQGKTTVMRMLRQYLKEQGSVTVWFEPWKYNTRDDVWKGLALTLAVQIREQQNLLREYGRKKEGLKSLAAEFLASRLIGNDWAAKVVKAIETEPWSPTLLHEFESGLNTLFRQIEPDEKTPGAKPVVLFVDDLDRCMPEAALAVLEALKLVLNRRGLITILGIAEEELTRSVAAAYAKELESLKQEYNPDWGYKYIQKIIQMPFPLPIVTERSFEGYIEQCLLQSQTAPVLGEPGRWCRIIREASHGNLREVKRFVNNFISEIDKASANSAALGSTTSFDPRRVAFILLLAWRFRAFLEHIRRQVNDPELFIRYQLFFSPHSSIDVDALRDPGKPFHEDAMLRDLFNRCFAAMQEGQQPLITPFAGWADLEPYLQFGKRTESAPAPASGTAASAEPPTEAATDQRSKAKEEVVGLLSEARSLLAAGRLDEAATLLRQGEATTKGLNDENGLGLILGQLGLVQEARGDFASAAELHGGALEIARRLGDRPGELNALANFARVQGERGDPGSLESWSQALTLCRSLGDQLGQVAILQEMGAAQKRLGRDPDALRSYQEALSIAKDLGHLPGALVALISMGDLHAGSWDPKEALPFYQEASELAQRLGDRLTNLRILRKLGGVYEILGDKQKAVQWYDEALQMSRDLDAREAVLTLLALSKIYREMDRPQEALLSEARNLSLSVGSPELDLEVLLDTAMSEADKQKAMLLYGQALEKARQLNDRRSELAVLVGMARTGQTLEQAVGLYQEARWIAEKLDDRAALLQISSELARSRSSLGQRGAAEGDFMEAIRLAELFKNQALTAQLWSELGDCYKDSQKVREAIEAYEKSLQIFKTLDDRESGLRVQEKLASARNQPRQQDLP
jgi:tetratricopeptide (TPR) repeat protein